MIVILLFAVQVLLFVLGCCKMEHRDGRNIPIKISMIISFSLAITAAVIWLKADNALKIYCMWISIGIFFSFIGDLVMAGFIKVPDRLIFGMLLFGITHVFYITAFASKVVQQGGVIYIVPFLICITILIVLWYISIYRSRAGTFLKVSALMYGTLVASMASFAVNTAMNYGRFWWLAASGGILFFTSDIIIALKEIGNIKIKDSNLIIWSTYALGQICIIYTSWLQSF